MEAFRPLTHGRKASVVAGAGQTGSGAENLMLFGAFPEVNPWLRRRSLTQSGAIELGENI